MANTYLSKSLGTPTNNKKWTFSAWCKRSLINVTSTLMSSGSSAVDAISMASNGKFNYVIAAGNSGQLTTTRLFQDVSGWYHIVVAVDTTQGTAANRVKIYINGVQETSFSTSTYPSQNFNTKINSAVLHTIGGYSSGSSGDFWNGSMSHIHFVDGIQYAPTVFGSVDSTSGIWKINTSPSVTYGNNGFFILKDGNTITDSSSNSNNFALAGGTLTKTEDCSDNNFSNFNRNYLARNVSNPTFSNGGTTIGSGGDSGSFAGAIALTKGKYYWEVKIVNAANARRIGIIKSDATNHNSSIGFQIGGASGSTTIWTASYDVGNGKIIYMNATSRTELGSTYATATTNDIIGVALDCDNYKITWYKNGTLIYALALNATYFEGGVFPANRHDTNQVLSYNFGNGIFGTTSVSSAGTNASAIGIFEYNVPSGHTAVSTKGINL